MWLIRAAAVTFGALFCTNSRSLLVTSSGYSPKASKVSLEIEKEFINVNARSVLYSAFMDATCLAIKSRKLNSLVTFRSDLAMSRLMPVPNPWP